MNIIIDTHIFLWLLNDPSKIDKSYFKYLEDVNNNIYLSSMSMVELVIKTSIGKLKIDFDIEQAANTMGVEVISFNAGDALQLSKIPLHHKDPFDRMIIAQTISNNYSLISDDLKFTLYAENGLNLIIPSVSQAHRSVKDNLICVFVVPTKISFAFKLISNFRLGISHCWLNHPVSDH